ncbi:hypothetical protein QTN25_007930 [Entamoeba marina]
MSKSDIKLETVFLANIVLYLDSLSSLDHFFMVCKKTKHAVEMLHTNVCFPVNSHSIVDDDMEKYKKEFIKELQYFPLLQTVRLNKITQLFQHHIPTNIKRIEINELHYETLFLYNIPKDFINVESIITLTVSIEDGRPTFDAFINLKKLVIYQFPTHCSIGELRNILPNTQQHLDLLICYSIGMSHPLFVHDFYLYENIKKAYIFLNPPFPNEMTGDDQPLLLESIDYMLPFTSDRLICGCCEKGIEFDKRVLQIPYPSHIQSLLN